MQSRHKPAKAVESVRRGGVVILIAAVGGIAALIIATTVACKLKIAMADLAGLSAFVGLNTHFRRFRENNFR